MRDKGSLREMFVLKFEYFYPKDKAFYTEQSLLGQTGIQH